MRSRIVISFFQCDERPAAGSTSRSRFRTAAKRLSKLGDRGGDRGAAVEALGALPPQTSQHERVDLDVRSDHTRNYNNFNDIGAC
jgi:hypothetical protein